MPARVQVIVEAKDAASGVMRAITSQFGQLGNVVQELTAKNVNWGNVAEQATSLVITGLKESVVATQEYAQQVRDLSMISGTSAEETSRFVQVLDDFQLTAQDAETATRKLTQNGLAPTLETVAELADKYNKLNSAQEKNDFLIKNFGRSGLEWVNLLSKGGDEIQRLGDDVNENLILTAKQIQQAEEYRLALDQLEDTKQALMITTGTKLIPVLTDGMKIMDGSIQGYTQFGETIAKAARNAGEYTTAADKAAAVNNTIADWAAGIVNSTLPSFMKDSASGASAVISSLQNATNEVNAFSDAQLQSILKFSMAGGYQKIFEGAADKSAEFAAKQEELTRKFDDNNFVTELFKARVGELKDKLADGEITNREYYDSVQQLTAQWKDGSFATNELSNATAGLASAQSNVESATRAAISAMLYQQVAASLDAKGQMELANKLGLVSQKDYAIAQALDTLKTKYDSNADGIVSAQEGAAQYASDVNALGQYLAALPSEVNTKVITEFVTLGTPGAGGFLGTTCFLAGTQILMSDGTQKNIEDIQIGEWVRSYDFYHGAVINTQVSLTLHHESEEMGEYYIVINDKIRVTPNHLLFINKQWQVAENIAVGDELQGANLIPVPVLSVSRMGARVKTYNLHVDNENHNYFADGILAHNAKGGERQLGGEVYAGNAYTRNERGAEPFIPSVNGRILGHAESLRALALGQGMGGGGNYNFYGNVTLTVGSEDASGLLSARI